VTPYHITLKWPASFNGGPDLMVNLYAASPEELASQVREVRLLAQRGVFGGFDGSAPAPIAQPEIHYEPDPEYPGETIRVDASPRARSTATVHEHEWRESQHGGLYCPLSDPNEAGGYCRWVRDAKGERRKPTRAELDAAKAAR
jgi:hypothetical protein